MFKKILITLSTAFISVMMLTAPSNAALFAVIDSFALTAGDVVQDSYVRFDVTDDDPDFIHEWHFTINEDLAVMFDIDSSYPAGSIANLTFEWINAASSMNSFDYTDGTGEEDASQTPFWEVITTAETWILQVTGSFIDQNATYSLQASVVPLPPAVIAFSTAMLGVGFLARRRKKKKAEFA